MKTKRYLSACIGILLIVISPAVLADNDKPNSSDEANRHKLSKHETIAEFQGLKYRLCLGETGLCPEQCDNSGEFATFKIVKYVNYQKSGKNGDPKQKDYSIRVTDFDEKSIDEELVSTVRKFKKGDRILLSWRHDYVTTKGGSNFQDHVVTKLQKEEKR